MNKGTMVASALRIHRSSFIVQLFVRESVANLLGQYSESAVLALR
jgi:hypothetical protein